MSYSSYRVSFGTSQTCLRVQGRLEAWKFRGLEAWFSRWGSAPHPYNSSVARLPGALFSVAVEGLRLRRCTLCSPFSGAALAAPPLPGRGAAPHTLQSANQPIPLCSLRFFSAFVGAAQRGVSSPPKAVARASPSVAPPSLQTSKLPSFSGASFVSLRGPSCPSCSPQNIPHPPCAPPVAPQGRSLFSVAVEGLRLRRCTLCSLFSGAALAAPPPSNPPGAQKTLAPGKDMLLFYCHALGEPMQRFVQTHKGHRTKRRNFRSIVRMRARVIACPCRCHWAGILRPRTRHRRRARLFAPCPPPQPSGDR